MFFGLFRPRIYRIGCCGGMKGSFVPRGYCFTKLTYLCFICHSHLWLSRIYEWLRGVGTPPTFSTSPRLILANTPLITSSTQPITTRWWPYTSYVGGILGGHPERGRGHSYRGANGGYVASPVVYLRLKSTHTTSPKRPIDISIWP